MLLEGEDVGEQVAVLFDSGKHVGSHEAEFNAAGRAVLDLVPRDRGRHGRIVAGAKRIRGDRGLVMSILAPVDEHLPGPLDLGHHRRHPTGQLALDHLADGEGEVGRPLVGDARGVERNVHLEALRA